MAEYVLIGRTAGKLTDVASCSSMCVHVLMTISTMDSTFSGFVRAELFSAGHGVDPGIKCKCLVTDTVTVT